MATTTDEAPVALPKVPADALATIDYAGSYAHGTTHLRLNGDKTFELTKNDGTIVTGNYTELADGSRIQLDDFDGGKPAWFSVGNGALYRLADGTVPYDQVDEAEVYNRIPDVQPIETSAPAIAGDGQ